jgi:DNA-binding LacI/PurR family transcriptional regulator
VPLSTIRTYSDKACEIAVELLMKKLKNQYFMLREKVTVSSDFVIRKSTGPNKDA